MSNLNNSDNKGFNNNQNNDGIILKIDRLYVKEINCKIPYAPGLFETVEFKESLGQMLPTVEISTKVQTVAENKYEVVLHAIVNGKAKNNVSLFVLEVQQAGIFTVNAPASQLKRIIESNCTSFLHAYLSQTISNAIIQAGFPPIILQPLQPIISQSTIPEQLLLQKKNSTIESIKHVQETLEKDISKPS
jgi:preprotein translocase subunit SecB